jgi:hypothetical protein
MSNLNYADFSDYSTLHKSFWGTAKARRFEDYIKVTFAPALVKKIIAVPDYRPNFPVIVADDISSTKPPQKRPAD